MSSRHSVYIILAIHHEFASFKGVFHVSRSSFALLVASVMLAVFVLGRQADSDSIGVHIFRREASCATFELSSYPEASNVLKLVITPFTSGDYSYSFSRVSGDSEYTEDHSEGYHKHSIRSDVRAYFTCDVPEDGGEIQYTARASFVPDFRHNEKVASSDSYTTENSYLCGFGHDTSPYHNVYMLHYVSADFSASVSVSNLNGTTYITIEEEE